MLFNLSVSLVEVRAFRASIPARRFPAIRDMTDEQIAQIVAKDKAARQSHPWDNTTQMDPLDDFRCSKTVVQNELKVSTREYTYIQDKVHTYKETLEPSLQACHAQTLLCLFNHFE